MISHIYKNPSKYSKSNALQYNFAMKILSKISFKNKSRVLDIGCGDGVITHEIAKITHEGCVIGTDISKQMVGFASNRYIDQLNLRFIAMDASKNIFREQFDIVTSFNCLHWVKNQQDVLCGVARSAAYDAQIALLLSHKKSLYHLILDKVCSNNKWKCYFSNFKNPRYFFDPSDYKEMVVKSGLQITELSEEKMTYSFKSKEQLKDFFNSAGAHIKQIPENKKADFLNDFVETYIKEADLSEQNLIPLDFWCLQVIATKPKQNLIKTEELYNRSTLFKNK